MRIAKAGWPGSKRSLPARDPIVVFLAGRAPVIDALPGERAGGISQSPAIIIGLIETSPDHATLPRDLAWLDAEIAKLAVDP